jgi:hypothetical protein
MIYQCGEVDLAGLDHLIDRGANPRIEAAHGRGQARPIVELMSFRDGFGRPPRKGRPAHE